MWRRSECGGRNQVTIRCCCSRLGQNTRQTLHLCPKYIIYIILSHFTEVKPLVRRQENYVPVCSRTISLGSCTFLQSLLHIFLYINLNLCTFGLSTQQTTAPPPPPLRHSALSCRLFSTQYKMENKILCSLP